MSTYFYIFNVQSETIYKDIAASLVVGLVAAVFPAWRAVKLSIADGLRRIDNENSALIQFP